VLLILVKFFFAGGLLFWLIQKGELDFSLVSQIVDEYTAIFLLALLLITFSAIGTAFRWKQLLEIKAKNLPSLSIIKLNWIGLFFSSLLPGAVTGDLIKAFYAKNLDSVLTKTYLLVATLMDRVLGLTALIMLLGVFSLLNFTELTEISAHVEYIVLMNLFLLSGALSFICTLFFPIPLQNFCLRIISKIPWIGKSLCHTLGQIWVMGRSKKTILKCLGMSLLFQTSNVCAIYLLSSPFIHKEFTLNEAFAIIPIGLISTAIPIAPSGMGIGHTIFSTLFSYFDIKNGASYFNLYFLGLLFINSLGIIPYLSLKTKPKIPLEASGPVNKNLG
jgi:uncharacterized membrane protein YbhN (UPF0104 family)